MNHGPLGLAGCALLVGLATACSDDEGSGNGGSGGTGASTATGGGAQGGGGGGTADCGDGDIDVGEACDDGNNQDGDGCSSTCEQETWPASAFPLSLPDNGRFVGNLRRQANGDVLALARTGSGAEVYRIGTDATVDSLYSNVAGSNCTPIDVDVSSDGQWMMVADDCGCLNRIDLSTDAVYPEFFCDTATLRTAGAVSFAPAVFGNHAGKAITAFTSKEMIAGPETFIDAITVDGGQTNVTAQVTWRVSAARFTLDGAALLVLSSSLGFDGQGPYVWSVLDSVAADGSVVRLADFQLMFDGMTLSPDGETLYLTSPRAGYGTHGTDIPGENALYQVALANPVPTKIYDTDEDIDDDVAPTGIVTDGLSLMVILSGRIELISL